MNAEQHRLRKFPVDVAGHRVYVNAWDEVTARHTAERVVRAFNEEGRAKLPSAASAATIVYAATDEDTSPWHTFAWWAQVDTR
ncbi:MAG: hypothetical protein JWO67_3832 [Streptosporangiaceae bacterium]|nr:hypothetical protein [Streptosporangiaceae bacterium]